MIKIGTIGTGSIVDLFIESSKKVEEVKIELIYSRSLQKAQEFATKHGVSHYCDSLEELFNSSLVDTIYIASPNSLHYPQAKQALEAKKNVILEKPVCATTKQYHELMDIAKEHGVYIVEAITNLHCANMQSMKQHLSSLGPIKIVSANFSQYSSRYDQYKQQIVTNVFDPKMEGGALVDINIYNIYVCVNLFGTPLTYQYIANKGFNGIDTSGVVILRYPNFVATLIGAKDCTAPNVMSIQGEDGSFIIDQGSSGRCAHVSHMVKNQVVQEFNQDPYHMKYEIQDFAQAFNEHNDELIHQWNTYTLTVLDILENCKKMAMLESH